LAVIDGCPKQTSFSVVLGDSDSVLPPNLMLPVVRKKRKTILAQKKENRGTLKKRKCKTATTVFKKNQTGHENLSWA
jgi:hypothetical protein